MTFLLVIWNIMFGVIIGYEIKRSGIIRELIEYIKKRGEQ